MRPSTIVLSVISVVCPASLAKSPVSTTTDVFYWPPLAPEPSVLARISHDPITSSKPELISYSPPNPTSSENKKTQSPIDQDTVQIGLYIPTAKSKRWVGTLTSLSALSGSREHKSILRLHLNPSNEIYHVSLIPSSTLTVSSTSTGPIVELVPSEPGPRPHLNQPIVVSPDGAGPEEVSEKTLFQK
ncbi:uncharacterized protein ATNIH1004_002720 [Aspergillus tanneri]|nr:uncharacterized protein ATNIH1004_002720 [Aspergillus tanneri]KAA8650039.1 hypothetical protein ATNIH1004_002720 [Aspergillus tanneri]